MQTPRTEALGVPHCHLEPFQVKMVFVPGPAGRLLMRQLGCDWQLGFLLQHIQLQGQKIIPRVVDSLVPDIV